MQKVVDYTPVKKSTATALSAAVKQHMEAGWVPSGTVVVFDKLLVQAMVKFEAV